MSIVAVVGASGFVGGAVCGVLREQGVTVRPVVGRWVDPVVDASAARLVAGRPDAGLVRELTGCDAVVNAAGISDASSRDTASLFAANGALAGLVGSSARRAGVPRYVHVSSAVVQGRLPVLDGSERTDGFSDYARSKILGEELALECGPDETVVYRPPSVHGPDRRVSRMIARLGASALGSVAAPGTDPSPQALLGNVASAVAHLALTGSLPPRVVAHPWENLTTSDVMQLLGGRRPARLPRPLARAGVMALELVGRVVPAVAANGRRVEMMWFGQGQARSWLTDDGWTPPQGRAAWEALGAELRAQRAGRRRS